MPEVSPVPLADAGVLALRRPSLPVLVPPTRRPPRRRPPRMNVPAPSVGSLGDEFLVVTLDRPSTGSERRRRRPSRLWSGQIRQDARHADETDLAIGLEVLERLDRVVVLLERRLAR